MIQLSGGIALASMAGCLGSSDEEPKEDEKNGDDNEKADDESTTDEKDDGPKTGDDAPSVDLETHDGEKVSFDAGEKPTVVMFADVTSAEGKSHSETLDALYEEYHERVHVVTVNSNLDASKEDLKEFHENYGGNWEHAMGTEEVLDAYGIGETVTLCIIDEDGKVVLRLDGDVKKSTIEQAIEAHSEY